MSERDETIKEAVRERYGAIAEAGEAVAPAVIGGCCGPADQLKTTNLSHGCSPQNEGSKVSTDLGYSIEELKNAPEGADLGLGCGNPQAIASLQKGERVLDLGSGAGIDVFIAARAVGEEGSAIGVDMTQKMIDRARENAKKGGFTNVEFRLGEIDNLPVNDGVVDVIMSNCVINLAPDKRAVYSEAFRALAPGGRLAVSDIVMTGEAPKEIRESMALYTGCVAGADTIDNQVKAMTDAGFEQIRIDPNEKSREVIDAWAPGTNAGKYVVSASITALKPKVN